VFWWPPAARGHRVAPELGAAAGSVAGDSLSSGSPSDGSRSDGSRSDSSRSGGSRSGAAGSGSDQPSPDSSSAGSGSGQGGLVGRRPNRASPMAVAPDRLNIAAARQVLIHLDATRADAFAHRDPALLASVYVAGPLRNRDVALLARAVPVGCHLRGVRTTFRDVRLLSRHAASVRLSALATLAPSRLDCAGQAAGHAPGAGPVTLTVELVRIGAGYRIERQTVG
jgi:hypothetical protein